MKRVVAVLLATVVVAGVSSVSRADDAQIAQQIVAQLRQQQQANQLRGFNIGIQVEQAAVTLMGQVASAEQATLALEVARRVPGVKLVINDLQVRPPVRAVAQPGESPKATPASSAHQAPLPPQMAHLQQSGPHAPSGRATPVQQTYSAQPVAQPPSYPASPVPAHAVHSRSAPQSIMAPAPSAPSASSAPAGARPHSPVAHPAARQAPVPYAPAYTLIARQASANSGDPHYAFTGTSGAAPVPMTTQHAGAGPGVLAPAYDNPVMPAHAWPSYAAYPNYAAVTYPTQYSATAWPYIGPFYPYPQVPLGWRKVSLEWDDGWWFLDFHSKAEH